MSTTYSFLKNHFYINGVEITGWAEGDDVIQVKRRAPLGTDKMGAGGAMMVSISTNRSIEMTIKLQQTSPSNAYLAKLARAEENPQTFIPIQGLWKDTFREDMGVSTLGYIVQYPEIKRGAEANEQEWQFVFENGELMFGSPIFQGLPIALAEGVGG